MTQIEKKMTQRRLDIHIHFVKRKLVNWKQRRELPALIETSMSGFHAKIMQHCYSKGR